jgi:type IV secretion/conjugal transfer VirB4 family ATPase
MLFIIGVVVVIVIAVLILLLPRGGSAVYERKREPKGLADLLLWYGLVEDGILLQHDGSLLAVWKYRGPDLASATHAEMSAVASRLNSILRLGSGWMIQVDALRSTANDYAARGAFSDAVTALIDEERRVQFESEGTHFETEYFLTLTYLPPVAAVERIQGYLIAGKGKEKVGVAQEALLHFKAKSRQFDDVFSSQFPVERLKAVRTQEPGGFVRTDDELLSYLRRSLTSIKAPVMLPDLPVFLNDLLAMEDFLGGMEPKLGERHVRVLSVDGFPRSTWPGALAVLDTISCEYRWHTRAILVDPSEAGSIIDKTRKKWRFQTRSFKDQALNSNTGATNLFAAEMAADAEGAMGDAASGDVHFCYFSSSIVLQHKDLKYLERVIGDFRKVLLNRGFGVRVETVNAVEAFLGTLPGNGYAQVRRPLAHTRNLVDLMPIASVWAGERMNPSALMPPKSPPLVYAATGGGTPFRLNLHYQDVAHTLIVGPTGSGKSVLMALLAAQWFRYPKAQVFAFDKGASLYALCQAAGGRFYDIGESGLSFQPLRDIDDPAEMSWGIEWVETLMKLQNVHVGPVHRKLIQEALQMLAAAPRNRRTLTELEANLQNSELKAALAPYVISGPHGDLLDANDDKLVDSNFVVCEMESLLSGSYSDSTVMAVLLYLFRRMERRLDGRPTLVPIDEAWLFLKHPAWSDKIQDWLKTLRKKNAAVVLATQSIADVKESAISSTILQSTATKIYLPNAEAGNESMREFYRYAGLNSREMEILQRALPKREYYIVHPLGRRLISFRLGPVALSFLGAAGPEDRTRIKDLGERFGEEWVAQWLLERRVSKDWVQFYQRGVSKYEALAS